MMQKSSFTWYEKAVPILLTVITIMLGVGVSYISDIAHKVDILMTAMAKNDERIRSNEHRIGRLENRYDREKH